MLIQHLNYQLYSKPTTFDKRVQMTSYYQERECDVTPPMLLSQTAEPGDAAAMT